MAELILGIISAALIAIPTIYAWKLSRDKKKDKEAYDKHIDQVHIAIRTGDVDKVCDELAKWL